MQERTEALTVTLGTKRMMRVIRCDRCGHHIETHLGMVGECRYGTCTCDEFAEEESMTFLADEIVKLRTENRQMWEDLHAAGEKVQELEGQVRALKTELKTRRAEQGPMPRVRGQHWPREGWDRPSSGGLSGND